MQRLLLRLFELLKDPTRKEQKLSEVAISNYLEEIEEELQDTKAKKQAKLKKRKLEQAAVLEKESKKARSTSTSVNMGTKSRTRYFLDTQGNRRLNSLA